MKIVGIIPSRFESSRFPGKPLVEIKGKSMIQRVYEQAKKSTCITEVIVATDDQRIFDHVLAFGGKAMMTNSEHQSGTERCGEVVLNLEKKGVYYDVVVNIQGDEPFISPLQLDKVCKVFKEDDMAEIVTLVKKIENSEELFNPNVVKAVLCENEEGEYADILYFSRQPIPFYRGIDPKDWVMKHAYYKHIGVYAFLTEELYGILELEESPLEKSESLEQLRWLANHYTIQAVETDLETIGIDTPEDLEKIKDLA